MQLTSLSLALTRAGFLSFSPASLFAASEPGVWYDPSDMSTMFQDAAGTTPVTAMEQPVGLILDKSKGLVLGPELVTNGGFSNGTTGWTASNSTLSVSDGFLVITNISNSAGSALQAISTIVGRTYKLTCTFVQVTSSKVYLQVGTTQGAFNLGFDTKTTASGTLQVIFTAVGTTSYIGAFVEPLVAGRASRFDNISVRELPGNHATQTTSTSRPVLSARYNLLTKTDNLTDAAWTKQTGTSVDAIPVADPDGALTAWFVVGNGGFGIFQALSGTASLGQTTRSVYMRTRSGTATVSFKDPVQTQGVVACNLTTTWQRFTLTETTTPSGGFSAGIWIDDIPATGIEIAWPDLRPANQASLPYQRVNTSTDYDADPSKFKPYLRFDGVDDWLVTPTITPGIDKVQVFAGVRKLSDAAVMVFWEHGDNQAGGFTQGNYNDGAQTLDRYNFWSRGSTIQGFAWSGGYPAPTTNALTGIGDISGDSAILRVNGTHAAISTTDQGTGNYLAYPLYIGRRGGTSYSFNGHLYGLIVRFGANLPAATIASTETWLNGKTGAY